MELRQLILATATTAETGVVLSGLGAGAVVAIEFAVARRRQLLPIDTAPEQEATIGVPSDPALRLVVLGDSTAAGVGVDRPADTVGRQLASLVARRRRRCVRVCSAAVTGSASGDLGPQVSRALLTQPDIAVILVGLVDVLRLTPLREVASNLGEVVRRLRSGGTGVVVGTCPDLGAAPAFAQPMRALLGRRGKRIGAVQTAVTEAFGGVPVDLAATTGRIFRADRGAYSTDGLHPSADGYRLWAEALAMAIAVAGDPVPA
ncbi:MAG: SGNH/GDSL hydrolase family protein [Mycobacteriales bacterium]